MSKRSALITQIDKVRDNLKIFRRGSRMYHIPDVWLPGNFHVSHPKTIAVNPAEFFTDALEYFRKRESIPPQQHKDGTWSSHAVIYNLFVRTTCTFDHDRNGSIDLPLNKEGWRETGTFMKAIALLPYMRSLGANTIHLLPITSIGSDGNKGTLGSPYAIKNPYHLDDKLHEPNCGLTAEEEFRLFVRAAHHVGMRVVVEFVFRTASKDADWITEHPEWFYWIKEKIRDRSSDAHDETSYGNPIFTKEELHKILTDVENVKFSELTPPHAVYRAMFTDPPGRGAITIENGRCIGKLKDGTRVRIPGAFADWPPDDAQPPWGDVTYLRMYTHPDFNYIAYNTIRMYDSRLAQPQNITKDLWDKIIDIIPYYQQSFGIDGVMIDMGHALPMELKLEMIKRARYIDPDFAFWDENFSVDEKSIKGTVILQQYKNDPDFVFNNPLALIDSYYKQQSQDFHYRRRLQNRLFVVHHSFITPEHEPILRTEFATKERIFEKYANLVSKPEHQIFDYMNGRKADVIFFVEREDESLQYGIGSENLKGPVIFKPIQRYGILM